MRPFPLLNRCRWLSVLSTSLLFVASAATVSSSPVVSPHSVRRCAWLNCPVTEFNRRVEIYRPSSPRWKRDPVLPTLWRKEEDPPIHDGVYCHKHTSELSKITRSLSTLQPPSRASSASSSFSCSDTVVLADASASASTSTSTSALLSAPCRVTRQQNARRALDFDSADALDSADAPNERTVGVELDDRREEERQPDSERGDRSQDTGVPNPAGAQPREGETSVAPTHSASAVTASSSSSSSSPLPLGSGSEFATPTSRTVRRTQSLAIAAAAVSHSPLAHRSASMGGLPNGAGPGLDPVRESEPETAPASSPSPPCPALASLVHVENQRVSSVRRSLSGENAALALAEKRRKRALADEQYYKPWKTGYEKCGDERAPWHFDVILGLLRMIVCSQWDAYHRGRTNHHQSGCQGLMVADGVKRVASPAFACAVHCATCGRRVKLYNFQSDYVAIGYRESANDTVVRAMAEDVRNEAAGADDDAEDSDEHERQALRAGLAVELSDSDSEVEATAASSQQHDALDLTSISTSASSSAAACIGPEEKRPDVDQSVVSSSSSSNPIISVVGAVELTKEQYNREEERLNAAMRAAGESNRVAHAVALGLELKQLEAQWRLQCARAIRRRQRVLRRQQSGPTTFVRRYIIPPEEPICFPLKGFFHVAVLRLAAICLSCGMRSKHLARLDALSDSVQILKQTTLFRYFKLIKHYVQMLYDRDHEHQLEQMRRSVSESQDRARLSGQSAEEVERAGQVLVLAGDGAWCTRGWSGKAFTYVVCNLTRPWRDLASMRAENESAAHSREIDNTQWLPPVCYMYCIMTKRRVASYLSKRLFKILDPVLGSASTSAPTPASLSAATSASTSASLVSPSSADRLVEWHFRTVKGYENNGNWEHTKGSANMEGEAVQQFISYMTLKRLLPGTLMFVTDGDTKIAPLIHERCPHVEHVRDPGHTYTKMRDYYAELCKSNKGFDGLPHRMYTWVRRCHHNARMLTATEQDERKRNSLMFKMMQCYMLQMIYHYHNLCDPATCPHFPQNQLVAGMLEADLDTLRASLAPYRISIVPVVDDDTVASTVNTVAPPRFRFDLSSDARLAMVHSSPPPLRLSQPVDSDYTSVDELGESNLSQATVPSSHLNATASDSTVSRPVRKRTCTRRHVPSDMELYEYELAVALAISASEPRPAETISHTETDAENPVAGPGTDGAEVVGRVRGRRRGRGRARGQGRGEDSGFVDSTAPGDDFTASQPSLSSPTTRPRTAPKKRKKKASDTDSDTDDGDDEYVDDAAPTRTGKSRKQGKAKGLARHLEKLETNVSGSQCRDNVLKELQRRQEVCEEAKAKGGQRPYGTPAAEQGEQQKWRMWLDLTGATVRSHRNYSHTFTSCVVASIYDQKLKLICHGYSTTFNESFNSQRARITPKDVVMPWLFECRSQITVLNRNRGVSWRKQFFEMMGLTWTSRDEQQVQRSELARLQRKDLNERKRRSRRSRAMAKRHKELSAVMWREGCGDERIMERLQTEFAEQLGKAKQAEEAQEVARQAGAEEAARTRARGRAMLAAGAQATESGDEHGDCESDDPSVPTVMRAPLSCCGTGTYAYSTPAQKRRIEPESIEIEVDGDGTNKENIDPAAVDVDVGASKEERPANKRKRSSRSAAPR